MWLSTIEMDLLGQKWKLTFCWIPNWLFAINKMAVLLAKLWCTNFFLNRTLHSQDAIIITSQEEISEKLNLRTFYRFIWTKHWKSVDIRYLSIWVTYAYYWQKYESLLTIGSCGRMQLSLVCLSQNTSMASSRQPRFGSIQYMPLMRKQEKVFVMNIGMKKGAIWSLEN